MGQSTGQILTYVVTHPMAILLEVLSTPGKVAYLFVVFGLLAFIPLMAPSYLIPTLPLLAIAMLSRLPNYYDYNSHYTAGLIIPVLFAFIHGLPKANVMWIKVTMWGLQKVLIHRHQNALYQNDHANAYLTTGGGKEAKLSRVFYLSIALWILAGHMMISPSPISRLFWSDKVWSYSWRAYIPTERNAMMKTAILQYIPADANVSVSTQNTVNWHHLALRKVYMPFPFGVDTPRSAVDYSNRDLLGLLRFASIGEVAPVITYNRYADYVVLDLKRPWFIIDKGCDWLYGACRNDEMAAKFLRLVNETRQRYDTLFDRDGFMILRLRIR
jgi:hypothetical protein